MDNREIDRQIAEKVMGWTLDDVSLWQDESDRWTHYMQHPPHAAYRNCVNKYWRPSTNIAHAFELVEKMKGLEWIFEIGTISLKAEWYAEFQKGIEYPFGVHSDTPTMAICLAALKTLEQKE